MVKTAFALKFTTPCKLATKCGIYRLCFWFPPRLHFFAPYLHRVNLCTVNPLLSPPGGLFISSPFEGGLIETGGLFERGGLFNLKTTVVSVLHKELDCKAGKSSSTRSFRSCRWGSESNPIFQLVNKSSWISPHEVLQSWLIDTVYHLLVKNK